MKGLHLWITRNAHKTLHDFIVTILKWYKPKRHKQPSLGMWSRDSWATSSCVHSTYVGLVGWSVARPCCYWSKRRLITESRAISANSIDLRVRIRSSKHFRDFVSAEPNKHPTVALNMGNNKWYAILEWAFPRICLCVCACVARAGVMYRVWCIRNTSLRRWMERGDVADSLCVEWRNFGRGNKWRMDKIRPW